jgi:hypothetical protein
VGHFFHLLQLCLIAPATKHRRVGYHSNDFSTAVEGFLAQAALRCRYSILIALQKHLRLATVQFPVRYDCRGTRLLFSAILTVPFSLAEELLTRELLYFVDHGYGLHQSSLRSLLLEA